MELRILLQAARRSAVLVACTVLVGALLGLVVWAVLPSAYQASAVLVLDSTAVTVPGQEPFSGDPERYVTRELESLRSQGVVARAVADVEPRPTEDELLASIELSHVTGSDVVRVTARTDTAARARAMADAVATSYVELRQEASRAALDDQRAALEEEAQRIAARLSTEQLAQPVADALYASYDRLTASITDLAQPGVLRDATRVADTAREASPTRALGLGAGVAGGGLLGGLTGLGVAVLRTLRRPRVVGPDELELLVGRPVAAEFPRLRGPRPMAPEAVLGRLGAPAGRLAAVVGVEGDGEHPLVVACASAVSPAGCSTVAAALALRLAQDGLRVTAVVAGVREPAVRLVPATGAAEPVVPLAADGGRRTLGGVLPTLTVIDRQDGGRLTAEDQAKALLEASGADVVVVDVGSVLDSPHARAAVRRSDRVVLVVPDLEQPESDLRLALDLLADATAARVHVAVTHL